MPYNGIKVEAEGEVGEAAQRTSTQSRGFQGVFLKCRVPEMLFPFVFFCCFFLGGGVAGLVSL